MTTTHTPGALRAAHAIAAAFKDRPDLIRFLDGDMAEIIDRETGAKEMLEALEAMQKAADEIAIEFIAHKRAANWAIINDAYLKAEAALRKARRS